MIKIYLNDEDNLVYWILEGNITKTDIKDSIKKIYLYKNDIRDIKIIQIVKNINARINPLDNIRIAIYAKTFMKDFLSIRFAFVGEIPKHIAYFLIAVDSISNLNFKAKAFAKEENAINWLNK